MDLVNIGYCIIFNKQCNGNVVLSIHRRRMHAAEFHIEVTDRIRIDVPKQLRSRLTDGDSRRLVLIEIDINSRQEDSHRFHFNTLSSQFPERSATAITTHRASRNQLK